MKQYIVFDYCNIQCQDKIICNNLTEICNELSERYNYKNLTTELIALFERHKSRFIPKDTVDRSKMDHKIHTFMSSDSLLDYLNNLSFTVYNVTSITVNTRIEDLYSISLYDIATCRTEKGTTIWKILFIINKTKPINTNNKK